MSECPFVNLVDPGTYENGMPYQALKAIRDAGPAVKMDDPITGVPYWVITRQGGTGLCLEESRAVFLR